MHLIFNSNILDIFYKVTLKPIRQVKVQLDQELMLVKRSSINIIAAKHTPALSIISPDKVQQEISPDNGQANEIVIV